MPVESHTVFSLAPASNKPVLTPCIGVCELNDAGFCIGCNRNGDEIARWRDMSDTERLRLMNEVLPQRVAQHGNSP